MESKKWIIWFDSMGYANSPPNFTSVLSELLLLCKVLYVGTHWSSETLVTSHVDTCGPVVPGVVSSDVLCRVPCGRTCYAGCRVVGRAASGAVSSDVLRQVLCRRTCCARYRVVGRTVPGVEDFVVVWTGRLLT